ncbi:M28 family peptidase [Aestuariivivens sediminis]|uniref:M28 family peptidase n=1 Tax=Aestuariivivens sediminis TaxID=2913557 RepID=UPI001F586712|nr:M28 family peptidase [Aestuariivivens sediminis]
MIKIVLILSFISLVGNTTGYAQEAVFNTKLFNKEEMLIHVKNLSSDAFEGRRTGTKGASKARNYIMHTLKGLKIKPLGKTYEQSFLFSKNQIEYQGVNVLGLIKGTSKSNKYIVVSAHYDHEGIRNGLIYNGADDNASGVSALFSFAEFFNTYQPRHSVILAAFDGEELGLKGSKYFTNNTIVPVKNIVLNINMDMIGRSDKEELYVVGSNTHINFKSLFFKKEPSCCTKLNLVMGHDGHDGKDNWLYSSDHASFYEKGIPFLYFGVEDHEDYHEPTDDFEKIQPEFYGKAVSQIIAIFKKLDLMSF